jgi:hypothetical protein
MEQLVANAASQAARRPELVRDDPAGRYELAEQFYRRAASRGRYGAAELSFLRWSLARGVLATESADKPGSPWWRAVNEPLVRDKVEADLLTSGAAVSARGTRRPGWRPGRAAR